MEINFNDAQQALGFILPQQLRIETEVYEIKYPSYDFERMVPVTTEGDMWDIGSVFFSGDIAGKAEWLSTKGFDMPFADVATSQYLQTNNLAGIGYEWSLGELKRAEKQGTNLPNRKARAAKKVAQKFKYDMAIRGNTEKNRTGLINDANVPVANVPNDGTGSTRTFSTKTPDQILRDLNEMINAPFNASLETEEVDTIGLPSTTLQYLATLRIGDGADTMMKFFRENNSYTARTGRALTIFGSRELETAGTSSTKRMIAYSRQPEVVQFHLPGDHEFLEPFRKSSMTWEIGGIMNIGGIEVRLPKAMAYRDGI